MKPKSKKKLPIWYVIRFTDGSTVGHLYISRKMAIGDQTCYWPEGKVIKVNLVEID